MKTTLLMKKYPFYLTETWLIAKGSSRAVASGWCPFSALAAKSLSGKKKGLHFPPSDAAYFGKTSQKRKVIFTLTALFLMQLLGTQALAQPLSKIWDKRFGGTEYDFLGSTIATSDGGFLLGGGSYSGATGDRSQPSQGAGDAWLVKIDADGNKLWDKRFGGMYEDYIQTIVATSDGGFLLGCSTEFVGGGDVSQPSQGGFDYWVIKIDADGNKLWDKCFGGNADDELRCITPTPDGNFLLGGLSGSGAIGDRSQPSRGGLDYWVVKIDANGIKLWDRRFGGTADDELYDIVSTSDGGFLLGGASQSGANGDKSQSPWGNSNFVVLDYWVVRIDANGDKLWDKRFGGDGLDYLLDLTATPDGGFLLAGASESGDNGNKSQPSQGGSDYWMVKIDTDGNKLWDKCFGGTEAEILIDLVAASDGGFLLAGFSGSEANGDKTQPSQGLSDYWLVKIDTDGNKLWDKRFGGTAVEELFSLNETSDGGFLLGGHSGSGDNGDKSQPSQGVYDYWVVKIRGECPITASITPNTPQNVCSGTTLNLSGSSTGTTSPTYAWTGSPTGFSSDQQNPSFTVPTVASSTNYTLTLTVTEGVCTTEATIQVTVHPIPNALATPSAQTICSANAITPIILSGNVEGTVYHWSGDNTAAVTGIAATGSGNISGSLTNTTNAPVTVTFTITPTANNCPGASVTATVLVNPTPNVVATPPAQTICSNANITPIILNGNVVGTVYNWSRDNTAPVTGIAATGSGNINGSLTNNTNAPVTVTFTIIPTANNCPGSSILATTIVKPAPSSQLSASQVDVCPNTEVTLDAHCSIPNSTVNWNPGAPTVTPNAATLPYIYKASCAFDGCTGNESSVEIRTHRVLVDMKDLDVGTLPLPIARAVKDNMGPTNQIEAPTFPRRWTFIANGCDASESAVFKLSGPVNFMAIDNAATYAMFANDAGGFYSIDHPNYGNGGSFPNGSYTLTVDLRSADGMGGPFPKNRVATGSLLATRTLQFTVNNSGAREGVEETALAEEQWLSVGQNPVNTEVVVRLSGQVGQAVELSLTNLQGQTIQQRSVVLTSVQQYEVLPVTQAASGLYILKGLKENQAKTLKVVKIQ